MQVRNFGLDVVRTIAILPVAAVHYLQFAVPLKQPFVWPMGRFGVTIFFALSGFLIGRIMLRQFDGEFGWQQVKIFYLRRWLRTLPLYYTFLVVAIFVGAGGIGFARELDWRGWLFIPFLQNFAWPMLQWFSESWSLAVEEWFYLLFPLAALSLKHISVARRIALIAAMMAVMPALLRAGTYVAGVPLAKNTVIGTLDQIAFGVLAACVNEAFPKAVYRARWLLMLLGLMATVINYLSAPLTWGPHWFLAIFLPSTLSASIASTIVGVNSIEWSGVAATLFGQIIYWISSRSYALYLCHGVVVRLMLYNLVFGYGMALSLPIYVTCIALLAEISHRLIEVPFMKKRPAETGKRRIGSVALTS